MAKRELVPQDASRPGVPQRRPRAGSTVLAALAGAAVLCAGTTAAALAAVHAGTLTAARSVCQALPTPPGPTPSVTPGGANKKSKSGSGPSSASSSSSSASSSPVPTELCLDVQATASTVQPGQTARFTIDVEPAGGVVDDVTVQISLAPSSFPPPAFTVCGPADWSSTCKLGVLRAKQVTELQAQITVPKSAAPGTATLTATVTGAARGASSAGSVSEIAPIHVVAAPPTSPSPKHTHSSGHGHGHGHSHHGHSSSGDHSGGGSGSGGGVGTNQDPSGSDVGTGLGGSSPLSGLPPLTGAASGSSTNPGSLFPTISPSTGASGPAGSPAARTVHGRYRPTTVADVLPLNTRQVGSQLAGLIVLAIGVAIAVVRVSLRKPRAPGKP